MPNLAIQPATVPVDAPFPPASAQAMLNFVAAYLQVSGLENLQGVIKGATAPAAEDQDKAWLRLDPTTSRPLGIYVFNGEWTAVPLVVQSGDSPPGSPKKGELYLDKNGGLQIYDGAQWTSNLFPTGTTADRPTNVPVNSLYFDTGISRLLRFTTRGWSTFDGAVGEVRIFDAADMEDALTKNPGWAEFTSLANKFPLGQSSTYSPQSEGGAALSGLKLTWDAKALGAQGGSRESNATMISSVILNGNEKTKYAPTSGSGGPASPVSIGESTIDLTPPYKAMIFLRKEY